MKRRNFLKACLGVAFIPIVTKAKNRLQKTKTHITKNQAKHIINNKTLPSGTYEGIIKTATIKSSTYNKPVCVWEIETTSPVKFKGIRQKKFACLSNKTSMEWFVKDLEALGIIIPHYVENIPDAINKTEGLSVLFRISKRQGLINVNFIDVI